MKNFKAICKSGLFTAFTAVSNKTCIWVICKSFTARSIPFRPRLQNGVISSSKLVCHEFSKCDLSVKFWAINFVNSPVQEEVTIHQNNFHANFGLILVSLYICYLMMFPLQYLISAQVLTVRVDPQLCYHLSAIV